MARSTSQKKADRKYYQSNIKQISLKLNRNTDNDIIQHLETVENVRGYLIALIRDRIILENCTLYNGGGDDLDDGVIDEQ